MQAQERCQVVLLAPVVVVLDLVEGCGLLLLVVEASHRARSQ